MQISCLLIICFFLITSAFAASNWDAENLSTYEREHKILDALLADEDKIYDPRAAPDERNVLPVDVTATMYILDISSVNDLKNEFSIQFYFRQKWKDIRLVFNGQAVDLPYLTIADPNRLWKPDTFFIQEKVGKLHTIMMPNSFMRLNPSGDILYSVRLSMTFSCNMDLRYYPLDSQKCSFAIESYGAKAHEVKYRWGTDIDSVGVNPNISVLGFSLSSFKHSSNYVEFSHGNYSRLEMELTFKRKIGFFMNKLYVPFVILVIVSWLSFWIRAQFASLRLTLILTILFIMFWIESDVSRHTPPVSYTKAIDVWTGVCLSFVFSSLLQFILVSQLGTNKQHRRKPRQCTVDPEALFIKAEGKESKFEKNSSVNVTEENAVSQLIAGNLCEGKQTHKKIDKFSQILYPLCFVIFNMIYWVVYCVGN